MLFDLEAIIGFEWDEGNSRKNLAKHGVTQREAEPVFYNSPLVIAADVPHSAREMRLHAFGRTSEGRMLQITFTLRDGDTLIRIISARDMSRYERQQYEERSEES